VERWLIRALLSAAVQALPMIARAPWEVSPLSAPLGKFPPSRSGRVVPLLSAVSAAALFTVQLSRHLLLSTHGETRLVIKTTYSSLVAGVVREIVRDLWQEIPNTA